MKRLIPLVLLTVGVTGCSPAPTASSPTAQTPAAPTGVPAEPGGLVTPAAPSASAPTSDGAALPVTPGQTFQFENPLDGAVLTGDTLVSLRGLPAGASFTVTIDGGSGPREATLVAAGPGVMTWRLGDLPDGAYQLIANVTLPNQERGIARTHVRIFRRAAGGGGGATSGPPSPVNQPPLQPNAWTDLATLTLPQPRAEVGGGAVGNKFVVVGGFGSGATTTSDTFVFDATAGTWQTTTSMPTPRTALCSAVADGRIYAIGGMNDIFDPLPTVESYDPASDSWLQGADLPTSRFYAAAASLNDQLYVFGGIDDAWTDLTRTDRYDTQNDAWATAAPMPTARFGACAAALGNEVVVCGGTQGNSALKTVEAYKPATNTWRRLPDLPVHVAAGMAVSHGGRLYVFGGYDTAPLVTVWRYDPATNAWALHSVLQRDHIGGVAAAIGPKVYIAGGYNGIEAHDRFQVMTPLL
jgi:N-acetylneuraminic acid mutarotase